MSHLNTYSEFIPHLFVFGTAPINAFNSFWRMLRPPVPLVAITACAVAVVVVAEEDLVV